MLFDLRGSGRRRTVKAVYLTLAVLMGGGLVLFGIGGDVSGGLVDAITERGGGGGTSADTYRYRAAAADRAARANPQDAAAWAAVARARYQLASTDEGFDRDARTFNAEGRRQLEAASTAWERHLSLDPAKPDDGVASLMINAYSEAGLNEPEEAVRAQEIITESRPGESTFANLAVLAYQAGQTRKGDLARKEALRRADKADRETLKAQIDEVKQQSLASQIQQQTPPADTGGDGGGSGGGGSGGGGGGAGD
jgi:tetratricopeptide (TPR) repeat protein